MSASPRDNRATDNPSTINVDARMCELIGSGKRTPGIAGTGTHVSAMAAMTKTIRAADNRASHASQPHRGQR